MEYEKVFDILSLENISYEEKIIKIYENFNISLDINSDEIWRDIIEDLEYLNLDHKELFLSFTSDVFSLKGKEKILERAFFYFIYRHCFSAQDEGEFLASLGLAMFCERLFASVVKAEDKIDATLLARIVSEEIEYSQENIDAIKFEFMF